MLTMSTFFVANLHNSIHFVQYFITTIKKGRLKNLFMDKICLLFPNAKKQIKKWSWWWGLNPRPADYESAALPLSHTSTHYFGSFQKPLLLYHT